MKIRERLKPIWNEFVYGGHLLSLGAVSIVYTSAVLLDIRVTWDCLLVIYLGTQSAYSYNRYREFEKDALSNPERTRYLAKYVKRLPIIIVCMVSGCIGIVLYFEKIPALVFTFVLLSIGFSYSLIFKNVAKRIIGFKDIFVSLGWALLAVFLALYYSYPLNLSLFLVFLLVFLRLLVDTTFFDIKDVESDRKEGLLTPAIVLGRKKLYSLLYIITILAAGVILAGFYFEHFPAQSLMLLLTVPYTYNFLRKSQNNRTNKEFLYNVIVDGEFVLWTVFVLLGKAITIAC